MCRQLPFVSGNNSSYEANIASTAGWAVGNGALSVEAGGLRFTKTTATSSLASATRTVALPVAAKTWILYGRVRMQMVQDDTACFRLFVSSTVQCALWLNFNTETGARTLGALSLTGYTGTTAKNKLCATGVDTSEWVDFALLYCSKFAALSLFIRQTDGTWKLANRTLCSNLSGTISLQVCLGGSTAVGAYAEFDRLALCGPNFIALGDSSCKGAIEFSPDPANGWNNDESSWQRHFAGYADLMNNLVVNVGVGGDDTTDLLARLQNDVMANKPKCVFVHGTMNAGKRGESLELRTANHQTIIDAVTNKGCHHVLLNSNYGTEAFNTANPGTRDYYKGWWDDYAPTLKGSALLVDIMQPQLDANGYADASLVASDGAHPSIACYQLIGEYIAVQ